MRLLHTSDWHLGQEFHGFARESEHEAFLAWLIDQLEAQAVDALLVTGDIYDSQNPPIAAQKLLYRFISAARRRLPRLDVVLIGGNHDSAGRLEAPGPLLEEFGVRVVGSLPRGADGALDPDRLLLPLHDRAGRVAALCVAVPFLRLPDLPAAAEGDDQDRLVAGVRAIYETALAEAAARLSPGQSLVATGHCFMTGGEVSDLSERRIFGGNQQALPVSLFPDSIDYVALGHLHKAQRVGGRDAVRYCGSPLPLSVTERDYRHQVVLVDLDGPSAAVTPLMVPRTVEILRVPAQGAAAPADALAALRLLEADPGVPRAEWPYLDVVVALSEPAPGLRRDIDEALAGKGVRLARLKAESAGAAPARPDAPVDLETLPPEEVFVQCWRRAHADGPPDAYLGAFRELLHAVEGGQ